MSRLHSSHRGRSASHRPYPASLPAWVPLDKEEVVEEAVKLSQTGLSPARIGLTLRDTHGVPSVRLVTGQRMVPLLKSKGQAGALPEDLAALLQRVVHLQQHLERHPKDLSNRRGLSLVESKIRRLSHYYRRRGVLPADWRYRAETAALQVQ